MGCEAEAALVLWLEFAGARAEYRLTGNRSFSSDLTLVRTIENEEQSLQAFCDDHGLDVSLHLIDLVRLKARKTAGSEHIVYLARRQGRVYKATHSGKYGKIRATPFQYLRRFALLNRLAPSLGIYFEDFASIEEGGHSLVSSMNYFLGKHPDPHQIAVHLDGMGFIPFSDKSGTVDYLHSESGIIFRDCHQANWVVSQGALVPIDIIPEFQEP